MIEQLWYTWSGTGIRRSLVGFQVRAASPGLLYQSEEFYQFARDYTFYGLPDNVDPDTPVAPVCLALLDSPRGKLLVHKVCAGRDPFQRPGNFFTHMLLGLPENFSARDAIRLWDAPFWQKRDVSEEEQSTKLPLLSLEELVPGEQHFRFQKVQEELLSLITAFLSPGRLEQRVVFKGNSQHIAMLIWGLTHSVPVTLFPPELTFSTYEYDAQGAQETIVGTTTADWLDPESSKPPVVTYLPPSRGYDNAELEADIEQFARFAVRELLKTTDGHAPALEAIVDQAEARNITTVEAFLALFKSSTQSVAPVPSVFTPPPIPKKTASPATLRPAPPDEPLYPLLSVESSISLAESQHPASPTGPRLPERPVVPVLPKEKDTVPGSPVPQDSDRFVVPVREQILDRFPESFTRFQRKRSFDRTKLRLSLVVLVVILLLFSYLLGRAAVVGGGGGGGGGRTNGGNAATIRPTASVQTLATISAQQTAVAQATEQALTTYTTSGDRDVVFGYVFIRGNSVLPASSTPTLPNGSSFTVSILFLNTGSSVWTASEYTLVCVPGNDPDCQNARFKGIMNNQSVRPGQMYAFSVMLTAKDPPGPHHITLSVAHNGKPVGASQAIHFSVSDS